MRFVNEKQSEDCDITSAENLCGAVAPEIAVLLAADRVGDPPRQRVFNRSDRDMPAPARHMFLLSHLTLSTGTPY